VRNYEADLSDVRLPIADILDPVGVRPVLAEVVDLSVTDRTVTCAARGRHFQLAYDRLAFALGSHLVRLDAHLAGLAHTRPSSGRNTVLVIGAGSTGIEVATEMPGRLRAAGGRRASAVLRHLCGPAERIESDMGESARPVIAEALKSLHEETRPGISVATIDAIGVTPSANSSTPER
jgi:NADH dehydrogenase